MTGGTSPAVHTVVKVGGGLLGRAGALDLVAQALTAFRQSRRVLVLPGGGPFADAVRQMFKRVKIGEDAAHWMAVLGMDQYAHALAARIPGATLVDDQQGITEVLQSARLPVLAPYRWLRAVDPLPHSWDVTSDSIAAWVAGMTGAPRLVLVKAPGAGPSNLVDAYFDQAGALNVETVIVTADDAARLRTALRR